MTKKKRHQCHLAKNTNLTSVLFLTLNRRMMHDELETDEQLEVMLPVDTVAERWGDAVASGFTVVPNSLIRAQAELGLTPNDVVVLLNLLTHWWHRDRLPFPRTSVIAKRSGLSNRTVQRSLKTLQHKGLVKKIRGADQRSRYELDGLRNALSSYAMMDLWYRPNLIWPAPGERQKIEEGEGVQNPLPRQP